jgi:hypothetical protein
LLLYIYIIIYIFNKLRPADLQASAFGSGSFAGVDAPTRPTTAFPGAQNDMDMI